MIASFEHGGRLPVDPAALAPKAGILVVEMATGVAENSAPGKETLIGQQRVPGFLNSGREVFSTGLPRRCTAFAASQKICQGKACSRPDCFDQMIHIAKERGPMKLIRGLLLFDRGSPVELVHDSPVTQDEFAVHE